MSADHARFEADWLALREPVDHRSRAGSLVSRLVAGYGDKGLLRILDLGAGTGSNMRYLCPRLPVGQEWTLADHDPSLLDAATPPAPSAAVERIQVDLAELSALDLTQTDLVTGSALLDLVSERWMEHLVDDCSRAGCQVLFALSYDGSVQWTVPGNGQDADDGLVLRLVNRHQLGDKGFGDALGPLAGTVADGLFKRAGYRTWTVPSPWRLTRHDVDLVRALVIGWESAAVSVDPGAADRVRAWAERRRHTVSADRFELRVGHVDLLAIPA